MNLSFRLGSITVMQSSKKTIIQDIMNEIRFKELL